MLLKQQVVPKLKKYFLFISVACFVVSLAHLLYAYLYADAKDIPMKWGTISEAIIWDFPHLNPLISSSDYNKYIVSILYRSLLKYNATLGKFVPDIVSCDIKNLQYIECFLQSDIKWSDGTDITIQDIAATMNVLKTTSINPVISSLLSGTTIEEKQTSIIFKNSKADINFLNVFLQPIVSGKVINMLPTDQLSWKFPTVEGLYSGKYKFDSISQDDNLWIKKLILAKNEGAGEQGVFIDKMVFKVFNDVSHFLKHKDSVNIFNDKDSVIADSMPRLQSFEYILPQYVSFFINTDRIPELGLRSFILHHIQRENIVQILSDKNFKPVYNPFMTDEKIDKEVTNKNIEQIIHSKGYYKKAELVKMFSPTEEKTVSEEAKPTEEVAPVQYIPEPSSIIVSPKVDKVNFVSKDDILLKWEVNKEGVSAVYVNEYKLKWFNPWDKTFYYRLKKDGYDTIKEGKNTYQISFEIGGKKTLSETLIFLYQPDEKKLEEDKQSFLSLLSKNTQQKKVQIDSAKKMQLDTLDDTSYYDKDLQKFTYTLYYTDNDNSLTTTANTIKESLWQFWINVILQPVALSDLGNIIKSDNKSYDMFLIGINLWYFDYNLFPYLHSSQIKSGFNLAKLKKLSLDILLEEGRSNSLSPERIHELEWKILSVLKEEQVMKTLYTPVMRNLVDKNIKNYSLKTYLYDESLRFQWLESAYVSEKRIINFWAKGFFNFFSFLKNTLLN